MVGGKECIIDPDLESYIDNLLHNWLKEKDLQQFRRQVQQTSKNGIVYGVADDYYRCLRLKFPIDLLLAHPSGKKILTDMISKKIIPQLQPNEKILNTNIPEEILKNAGLKENQYVQPIVPSHKQEQKNTNKRRKKL